MKYTISLLLVINCLWSLGQTPVRGIGFQNFKVVDTVFVGRYDTLALYFANFNNNKGWGYYISEPADSVYLKRIIPAHKPFITKNDLIIYSAQFIAGAADGLHEVLVNHIHTFERVWPHATMHWWNPKLSQENKKHFPTVLSDGYHVTRLAEHVMNYFSIGISMVYLSNYPKKKLPWLVLKKMAMSFLSNRLAFRLIYDVAFHAKEVDKNP